MTERYTITKALDKAYYVKGCPIILENGALTKDNFDNKILLQLKFRNISCNTIKALNVSVRCTDITNKELECVKEFSYLDLKVNQNEVFGSKVPIEIPDRNTRNFVATVQKVIFHDNTIYENTNNQEFKQIEGQETINTNDALGMQYIKDLGMLSKGQYIYKMKECEDYWLCSCGSFNLLENNRCISCGVKKEDLIGAYNTEILKVHLEAEKTKMAENEKLKAIFKIKKRKKYLIFGVISVLICMIAIMFNIYTSTPLPNLVESNNIKKLELLINIGKNVNMTDKNGNTAFYLSVKNNNLEITKLLLDNGAKANTNDKSMLQIACDNNNKEMLNLLVNNGVTGEVQESIEFEVAVRSDSVSVYDGSRGKRKAVSGKRVTSYTKNSKETQITFDKFSYKGDIVENKLTGQGTLYKGDKIIYVGGWDNGLYSGKGEIYWNTDKVIFLKGNFVNGNPIEYTRYYMDGTLNDSGTISEYGLANSNKHGIKQYN